MERPARVRGITAAAILLTTLFTALGATWPPEKFTNLKVLPNDIPRRELMDMMGGFTRALGVRCTYCHVGEEGQPLATYEFEKDDKATKRKAREMIRMVNDLNGRYLAGLEDRSDPPIRVECVTCHRGAETPRMLEDVLLRAYRSHGVDSTLATYGALRERYYGRFTYDFGSVPLTVVASTLWEEGHRDDALRLFELNVEKNPTSEFARRQYAMSALFQAYKTQGIEGGASAYADLKNRYGTDSFPERSFIVTGYQLLRGGDTKPAIAVFLLATEAFPGSSNAFDSLGEAYMADGDRARAIESYRRSLALDSANENAKTKLEELRHPRKTKK